MSTPSEPAESHALAGYRVVLTVPVQWGDQDAFGHVNNTVYLRWFESARIAYCLRVGLAAGQERLAPILASIACNFRRPVTFPDTVRVGARIVTIGRSSMTMEHAVFSEAQQAIAAEGTSVLVAFDYEQARPVPMPEHVRSAIAAVEGTA